MAHLVFITGGARSGKSAYAQRRCEELGSPCLYVATATVGDVEMAARVARHQKARGESWCTLEEPLELAQRLPAGAAGHKAVLLDCLTLWLSNRYFASDQDTAATLAHAEQLSRALKQLEVPVFVVSNELGCGIVPDNPLARAFRDLAGEVNQLFTAAADEAWLVASGLPLRLK